ncbi:hypothetical protein Q3G72_003888 [Acer saccharum]|nr:hypothetical protein Q3G72_003888 [Acer saccharum]
MNKHKVVVKGRIDPKKLLKKMKKKTGKRVEIVINKKELESSEVVINEENHAAPIFDCCKDDSQVLMMFSDENPNACSIIRRAKGSSMVREKGGMLSFGSGFIKSGFPDKFSFSEVVKGNRGCKSDDGQVDGDLVVSGLMAPKKTISMS